MSKRNDTTKAKDIEPIDVEAATAETADDRSAERSTLGYRVKFRKLGRKTSGLRGKH